jgi:hypothetical protein
MTKSKYQQEREIKQKKQEKMYWYISWTLFMVALAAITIYIVTGLYNEN